MVWGKMREAHFAPHHPLSQRVAGASKRDAGKQTRSTKN